MSDQQVTLVRTCAACPEQYDVFLDGEQIGYLRLRHGYFRAEYGGSGGEIVYSANPRGDGIFEYDERDYYLRFAIDALLKYRERGAVTHGAPDVDYRVINEDD